MVPDQHKAAPSQSLKHVTCVPFLINSETEALKYAQTTESTAVAFGWKNVDHATNRHLIEAWTSESDILEEKIVEHEWHFPRSGQASYRYNWKDMIVENRKSHKNWDIGLVARIFLTCVLHCEKQKGHAFMH